MATEKEIIIFKLEQHKEYVKSKLGLEEENIIGIFLYGSQNYGFSNASSDVDSRIIILPTFEQMSFEPSFYSKEIEYEETGEHIIVVDIREFRRQCMKQNLNCLETLFTEYRIMNPNYKSVFDRVFTQQRELIAHYDKRKMLDSLCGQIRGFLNKENIDNKNLHNAYRLHFLLKEYMKNIPYERCMKPTGANHDFMINIKYAKENLATKERIKEILERVDFIQDHYKDIDSPDKDAAAAVLDNAVIEILKIAFGQFAIEGLTTKKEFLKELTNGEYKAYYAIVKEIGDNGEISLSKMIEKHAISRPVFNNLLNKLKEYNIAVITNRGVKGTHIAITHPECRTEAIELKGK